MLKMKNKDSIFTAAVHAGGDRSEHFGAISTPIYSSSVFAFEDAETGSEIHNGAREGYFYGLLGNPTQTALERVSLVEAADRKVSAFSKGMRQRVRLAQSIAHNPSVLVLDEPLNGLDPMARAEIIRLFRQLADAGMYLVISSHILHEVDMMSDSVVLLHNGYVVAEGEVHGVRDEIEEHPIQILIRCDRPQILAARLFEHEQTLEARIHDDRQGLFVKTRRPDDFYLLLNKVITEQNLQIESVAPVDDDLNAVYQYLITSDGGQTR